MLNAQSYNWVNKLVAKYTFYLADFMALIKLNSVMINTEFAR